ncbi:DUF7673 family protein [Comamonas aquatica]|jgi:hypothetical protein|uniref:DUF7673 family protein n=1 Tax=Comamonas aquatica TaxID=225991 RepID=UPI00244BFF66|nr:hypothetical protein [Comamonas aquatica]MDH0494831.1 hypothetical protein [Comamonas aquatica]
MIENRSELSPAERSALIEEMRPMSPEEQAQSQAALRRLFEQASGFSSQAKDVARFLLSLWDSERFRFELSAFRSFDRAIVRDCLAALYWDSEVQAGIQKHIAGGAQALEELAAHWGLKVAVSPEGCAA